jgi:outer membrane biosynthesis protein TonB
MQIDRFHIHIAVEIGVILCILYYVHKKMTHVESGLVVLSEHIERQQQQILNNVQILNSIAAPPPAPAVKNMYNNIPPTPPPTPAPTPPRALIRSEPTPEPTPAPTPEPTPEELDAELADEINELN